MTCVSPAKVGKVAGAATLPALEKVSFLTTVVGMENRKRERQAPLTIHVKQSAVSEHQLQKSLFHIFDLLGLDDNPVSQRLRKPLEALRCNPNGDAQG